MTYQRGEVMTKTGLYAAIIAPPYTVSANKYRRPLKKAPAAAALLLLAAACLIPLSCSHPVNVGGDGGENGESMVTITLPGAERSASRSAVTGATIAQLEFKLTLTKGSTVKTAIAPPGKPSLKVPLAEGEWHAAAEAYLPAGHVHVGTGSTQVKVRRGQPNNVIITMVFDNTMPAAVTADYMGQTYTAVYAGNAVYTAALEDYHPAAAVAVTVTAALAEQDIGPVVNDGLPTSSYVGSSGQETLALGTSPTFTVGAGSGFTTNYTVNLAFPVRSDAKSITAFGITAPVTAAGTINEGAGTIIVKVPFGTAVTTMSVSLTHNGVSVSPASGSSVNFSTPQAFTVTAADGTTRTYTAETVVVGYVTTLAGSTSGFADGTGTAAQFAAPRGVAVDGAGNLYVADYSNNRIRKIVIASGVVTTLAGSTSGNADGTGTAALFNQPSGVALDGAGTLYVADYNNHCIRKIEIASGAVTTFAGSDAVVPVSGNADGTGTAARFYRPAGVAVDGAGNLYVAESGNSRIRKIEIATRVVTTLAGSTGGYLDGTGTLAKFRNPTGVTADGAGNLYVADYGNHSIRKIVIATKEVTTFAGNSVTGNTDGIGTSARFYSPTGVAVDGAGNLYVADSSTNRIRKIEIATRAVTTFAGGSLGYADGTLTAAQFLIPYDVALDGAGNLYVADRDNNRIRKIVP
jgi:sugar lactone lactonase YvrE